MQLEGRYSTSLTDYYPNGRGYTMCFTVHVNDRDTCLASNGYDNNHSNITRCCDAGLNKFKVWPGECCMIF